MEFGLAAVSMLAPLRRTFGSQPLVVEAIEAVILGDLLMSWGHRVQHRSPLLRRFHAVHHTTERLDWVAAHREHPADGLYTQTLMNLPAILLGLPIAAVAGLVAFRGMWAIFIHSNVALPLGPLELLLGSPRLHHWHHARDRDAGNYGNLAPYLDVIFGAHVAPEQPPSALVIPDAHPRGYLALLLWSFRPRRFRNQ